MGKRRLEDALKQIDYPIEVKYRCFELDPNVERDVPYNIYEKLSQKYGMSLEQAKNNCQNMEQMAKDVGLDFQLNTMILTNTFDAHRLVMFANNQGIMHEMTDRLLRAYYTESKHIGDHSTLIELAVDVGLNSEAVATMLVGTEMGDLVRRDEQEASEYGIRSIPYFLINKKYAITGAQPTETFVQSLKQIIEQDGLQITSDGVVCDENGCELPKK
ncbi:DsbA family oxidoreductase [Anaerobacillus sp. CMMVII]|uniref:DsbA family oxidoreductase n=1 Tax=Anaerobacillus sp. CMMVII TaxID=2755588 RepID=UPI0021B7F196|nr:DsbA family oxidoreductase [Anaerobacillus sp. CMMVII]MCT8136621.1 DsbA family oxidoreductase [Anaerobacillus sp. CMMVII]